MGAMYQVDVGGLIDGRGVSTYTFKGERVMVEGVPMVRLRHGMIVRSHDWYDTAAEANLCAAMKIEEMGRSLLAQAEKMRASVETSSEVTA